MGFKLIIVSVIVLCLSVLLVFKINTVPTVPVLENKWWGPTLQKSEKEDISIKPFKIAVSKKVLDDLQNRINSARPFTPPLEGVAQEYGMNTNLLTDVVNHWKNNYNWTEREQFLNQFPQFKTSIQGLKIHFIHVKPAKTNGVKILPLLLLHGWPGSVREFYDIIPLLTTPQKGRNFVFEVIVPSLPGYGFSDGAVRPGLGLTQIAVIFKNLMERLGFNKYYVQGGDWGSGIVQTLAILYPEKILGAHSNFCLTNTPKSNLKLFLYSLYPTLFLTKEEADKMYPIFDKFSFTILEMGYMHLQATKPDTVGVALNDSPVGLAAYIIEKFTTWTNPDWKQRLDGGLTEKFSLTDILDNVMIYWVTNSITTSMRLYAESLSSEQRALQMDTIPINVPTACARFSHELMYQGENILRDKFVNLVQVSDYEGGHFAAFEEPKILANDMYNFVEKLLK